MALALGFIARQSSMALVLRSIPPAPRRSFASRGASKNHPPVRAAFAEHAVVL
ncbi:hypothetical protein COLSTE_01825 [Collinsella stercoris DSM 13279]|uniref:Uncharacterized protein n=1 Tax=Collinsella stercoris DSM 13279 TaxID=445975 RepID=B6GCK2_9ACTN|nr:hypothetical protein COLSTE_01825 [Collinsella stercoris DSM 13279]